MCHRESRNRANVRVGREINITSGRLIASLKIRVGGIEMLTTILKAVVKTLGAKNAVKVATSKPVRELGKKIIKHEIKKRLK